MQKVIDHSAAYAAALSAATDAARRVRDMRADADASLAAAHAAADASLAASRTAYAAACADAEAAYAAASHAADVAYAAACAADAEATAIAEWITWKIESIASELAAAHVADPLVGGNAEASDADDFDGPVLRRALKEAGLASDDNNVETLREALREALARY